MIASFGNFTLMDRAKFPKLAIMDGPRTLKRGIAVFAGLFWPPTALASSGPPVWRVQAPSSQPAAGCGNQPRAGLPLVLAVLEATTGCFGGDHGRGQNFARARASRSRRQRHNTPGPGTSRSPEQRTIAGSEGVPASPRKGDHRLAAATQFRPTVHSEKQEGLVLQG